MAHASGAVELSKSILCGVKRPRVYSFSFVIHRAVKNLSFFKFKVQLHY